MEKSFAIPATGVGRKDYSKAIEEAVEPVIRSYQQDYWFHEYYAVNAGETRVEEIALPADTVVMLYNFFLSVPRNSLIYLNVEAWLPDYGIYSALADAIGYQNVKIALLVGFPAFIKYKISMTNYGDTNLDMVFSAHGIRTEEQIYTGTPL